MDFKVNAVVATAKKDALFMQLKGTGLEGILEPGDEFSTPDGFRYKVIEAKEKNVFRFEPIGEALLIKPGDTITKEEVETPKKTNNDNDESGAVHTEV